MNIWKNYLAYNNGTLIIDSKKNSGTTVRFDLPLSKKILVGSYKNLKENRNSFFEINKDLFDGNSILIVDDDPLICKTISVMLDDHFTTYIAKDGVEAIKYAVDKIPDIILSDVEMPNMNGMLFSCVALIDLFDYFPFVFSILTFLIQFIYNIDWLYKFQMRCCFFLRFQVQF